MSPFCLSARLFQKSVFSLALLAVIVIGVPCQARAQPQLDLGIPEDSDVPMEEMQIPQFEDNAEVQDVSPSAQDMPPSADLAPPQANAGQQPASQTPPPLLPEASSVESTYADDVFYDAGDLVPTGELGRRAPRKVNPVLEPASKLIVVKKSSGPDSPHAQLVSASRAMMLGRYEAALDIYQGLYEENRKNPAVLMGVAVALQRMGDTDAAIAAYDELLEIEPGNVDAEVNMLGLLSEKYPQVALHRLTELRIKNPAHLGVVAQLAVSHAQLGQIEDAIKYLGIAASMQPNNPSHLFNMAVIADRAGKTVEAVQFYEQALEVDSIYAGGRSLPRDQIFERLARIR